MKPRTIILTLALIATIPFVVGEERLGDLNRDSIVLTPGDDINNPSVTTKDGSVADGGGGNRRKPRKAKSDEAAAPAEADEAGPQSGGRRLGVGGAASGMGH